MDGIVYIRYSFILLHQNRRQSARYESDCWWLTITIEPGKTRTKMDT